MRAGQSLRADHADRLGSTGFESGQFRRPTESRHRAELLRLEVEQLGRPEIFSLTIGVEMFPFPAAQPMLEQLESCIVGLVQNAFAGSAAELAKFLNGIQVTARALARTSMDVGPIVFPQLDRATILEAVRTKMTLALADAARRASVGEGQAGFLLLALELGLDGLDDAGPGHQVVPKSLEGRPIALVEGLTTDDMASMYALVQDLKRQGMTPESIRETVLFANAEMAALKGMPELTRETHIAETQRLLDAILHVPGSC